LPLGLKFTQVGTSSLLNYFKIVIDLGFYTKFHSYRILFSQEIMRVFE
jgi:hypothetical protein